jgi:hypothetical protein
MVSTIARGGKHCLTIDSIRSSESFATQSQKETVRARIFLASRICCVLIGPADAKLVRNNNGVSEPEFRLPSTIV